MKKGETLYILGHGVIGQGQLCLPSRGCHALRCLVLNYVTYLIHLNMFLDCKYLLQKLLSPRNSVECGRLCDLVSGCVCVLFRRVFSCGHDKGYRFCPIAFKLNDKRRNPIAFRSRGQMSRSTFALSMWNLVDIMQAAVFARSLSNFTCWLLMMRGGTLSILGYEVKG